MKATLPAPRSLDTLVSKVRKQTKKIPNALGQPFSSKLAVHGREVDAGTRRSSALGIDPRTSGGDWTSAANEGVSEDEEPATSQQAISKVSERRIELPLAAWTSA